MDLEEPINLPLFLSKLMQVGVDIKMDNNYFLIYASGRGYLESVEILLKTGANPDACNSFPLLRASEQNDLRMATLLITYGADPNIQSVLNAAVEKGHTEMVKLLIKSGADIFVLCEEAMRIAKKENRLEMAYLLSSYVRDYKDAHEFMSFCFDLGLYPTPTIDPMDSINNIRLFSEHQDISEYILNSIICHFKVDVIQRIKFKNILKHKNFLVEISFRNSSPKITRNEKIRAQDNMLRYLKEKIDLYKKIK